MQTKMLPVSIILYLKSGWNLGQTRNPISPRVGGKIPSNTVITRLRMPKACEIIPSPHRGRIVEGSLGFNAGLHWRSTLLASSTFGQIFLLLWHLEETVGIITARVGRQIKFSFLSLPFRSFFLPSPFPSFLPLSISPCLLGLHSGLYLIVLLHDQPDKENKRSLNWIVQLDSQLLLLVEVWWAGMSLLLVSDITLSVLFLFSIPSSRLLALPLSKPIFKISFYCLRCMIHSTVTLLSV